MRGALPVLGSTVPLWTNDIPAGSVVGMRVLGFAPDSLSLASLGAPSCSVLVQPVATDAFAITGSSVNLPLWIPNNGALLGAHIYGQSVTYTPGWNPLSLLFSNGLDLRLDV